MIKPLTSITVRIPQDLQKQLRKLSHENKVPLSEIVRTSVEQYLKLEQFNKLRSKVMPFAEAQGYLTDDEVFKAVS